MSGTSPHPLLTTAFGLLQRGDAQGAMVALAQVLAAEPDNATAHLYQGHGLYRVNRKAEALAHFERAAQLQPQFADAFYNRGVLQAELGQLKEAEQSFRRTLSLKPETVAVYANLGAVLIAQGHYDDAAATFSTLIKFQPKDARAYYNRGTALLGADKQPEAVADFEKAVRLNPDYAPAHVSLTQAHARLRHYDKALGHAERAVTLAPKDADLRVAHGDVLRASGRFADAIQSYTTAIELRPQHGPSYVVRGDAYTSLKQFDKAAADYVAAANLDPHAHFAAGYAVQALAQICDWPKIDWLMPIVREGLRQNAETSTPFSLLACDMTAQEHLMCARIMAQRIMQGVKALSPKPRHEIGSKNEASSKIRIGYFSPDFGPHAVSYLLVGVLEAHARDAFEIIGFSYGGARTDDFSCRVAATFDRFIDVTATSDREVAALAQSLHIDIAVDLAGYTGKGRPGIFAHRVAPVQVNFLGYTSTMGAPFMDYIVVDDVVAPPGAECEFAEKLLRLPDTFLPSDTKRPRALTARRADFGLRDDQFVFCAFNNSYKINAATFASWLNILKRVENGVLWLTNSNTWQVENLRRTARDAGIADDRLIFAQHVPSYAAHLSRYQIADLFLDALPYNAHTTASDALWQGLPILTLRGDTFVGRVAPSVLTALGMPELITESRTAFEDTAVALALDPDRLKSIRQRIAERSDTTPVFDTVRFTQNLEKGFTLMILRSNQGLAPDHLHVIHEPIKSSS